MSAQKAALVTKPILGTALFALGTAVVLTRLVFFLTNSETDVLGALPAFGMALLRASTTLPFSGHGLFAVVLGVLDVLDLIGTAIPVVFVTAYDQYAMRAFEVHAVDYLLKPIARERFEAALERAKSRLGSQPATAGKLLAPAELAAAARPPQQYLERIAIRDGPRVTLISVAMLDYAEAQDDYVALASQGKKYLKQQTLASLEASLDPSRFVRLHRSYIVNLERVAKMEPYAKDSRLAVLADGTQLPVSRAGYARLKTLLDTRG
jgi:two-component system LytT family response regulator